MAWWWSIGKQRRAIETMRGKRRNSVVAWSESYRRFRPCAVCHNIRQALANQTIRHTPARVSPARPRVFPHRPRRPSHPRINVLKVLSPRAGYQQHDQTARTEKGSTNEATLRDSRVPLITPLPTTFFLVVKNIPAQSACFSCPNPESMIESMRNRTAHVGII